MPNAADRAIEKLGWDVGKTLGEGAFGLVKLVTRRSDGVSAACKIMATPEDEEEREIIENELNIMRDCDHEHIVKCYEAASGREHEFLFLELMHGGEVCACTRMNRDLHSLSHTHLICVRARSSST